MKVAKELLLKNMCRRKKIEFPVSENHLEFRFNRTECCKTILSKFKVINGEETFIEEIQEEEILPQKKTIGR